MEPLGRGDELVGSEVSDFQFQVGPVLQRLRAAISTVIQSVPSHEPIDRAIELQRALGIRSTLAWKVHKLGTSRDPLADATDIPVGQVALNRFLQAARDHGVPGPVVELAVAAVDRYEAFVKEHAPDRSAFSSMISALNDSGSGNVDLQYKREAFRANSHLWGVQAKTQLKCSAFQISGGDDSKTDLLTIRGLIGLKRLRRDAPWVISQTRLSDESRQVAKPLNQTPIDSYGEDSPNVSLLRKFCSEPLPKFRIVETPSGHANVELESTNVGNKSAVTCVVGDLFIAPFRRYKDEHNYRFNVQSSVRTPCRQLVHDVLMSEGVVAPIKPRVLLYGDHRNVDPSPLGRDCDLLSMHETVTHLGRGLSALHSPDVPRYAEMVQYAMEKSGWDPEKFDVWRCRVEFPVMPSSVVIQFDVPERPIGLGV